MDLFLNPAYFWAGVALVSAPIIIHLINRMRYKRIRWAAMEFLLKSQKRNRRRLIIEQLILLALRCLLIALAGFLVARFIGDIGTHPEKDVDHLVVIDDTLSMRDRWTDNNKEMTSFEVAKDKVLEIAKEALKANSPQYLHLVLLSDLNNEIKFNENGRLNADGVRRLEAKLADLKPSKLHVKPVAGVRWAQAKKLDANHQRVQHFVSDLRESDWTGPEADNLNKALGEFTNSGGKVLLFDVAYRFRTERQAVALHQPNIAIVDLRPETRFTAEGLPVQFTATIRNHSAIDKPGVFLNVKVDGQVRFEATQPVPVPPGDSKHTFMLSFNKNGYNMVSAALQDKDDAGIPDDNTRVAVIKVQPQVPILMIDGSEDQPNGARKDSYYLQKLFVDAAKGYRVVVKPRDALDDLELTTDRFPCVYLLDVPDLSEKALKRLEAYVEQGGQVAIFVGDHVKAKFYNDKLYADGNGLFPVPLDEKHPEPIPTGEGLNRLLENQYQIFFRDDQHPIFKEAADPKVREVFKFLLISEYWPAKGRLAWKTDPAKVQELVTLPNRGDMQTYAPAVTGIRSQLDQKQQDDKFAKYKPALGNYVRKINDAIASGLLHALATALDQLLNDRGQQGNFEKAPDLKPFWDDNPALRDEIAGLRDTVMYGDPLVLTKAFGKGKTVVFLTTAGKYWNDWAGGSMASPTYPVVMLSLQKYLTSATDESSRNVGAPLDIVLDAEGYQDRARVFFQPAPREEREGEKADESGGSEREVETVAGKEDDSKLLHFSFVKTREPGSYRVEIKGKPRPNESKEPQAFDEVFVYNVDAENESNLKRAAKDMLERGSPGQARGDVALITPEMRLTEILAPKRKDMSEAPWLYLVILIILIVEQALAVHLSFHLKGNEAQLPAGVAGEARTPVPTTEAA